VVPDVHVGGQSVRGGSDPPGRIPRVHHAVHTGSRVATHAAGSIEVPPLARTSGVREHGAPVTAGIIVVERKASAEEIVDLRQLARGRAVAVVDPRGAVARGTERAGLHQRAAPEREIVLVTDPVAVLREALAEPHLTVG